jgi:hypothetical protein
MALSTTPQLSRDDKLRLVSLAALRRRKQGPRETVIEVEFVVVDPARDDGGNTVVDES